MANEEQMTLLKRGVDVWNYWRRENPDSKIDLSGSSDSFTRFVENHEKTGLYGMNLSGVNLAGADLRGANLGEADLSRANLSKTQFSDSSEDLSNGNLKNANFSEANLTEADLSGMFLNNLNFSGAVLTAAILSDTDLSSANLSGAYLNEANLSGANLKRANLRGANLRNADLGAAYLKGADFSDTNLVGANFEEAVDLNGVETKHLAVFDGAIFVRSSLAQVNLSKTILRGVDFSWANLSGANLSQADLKNAKFIGANLSNAVLTKSDFSGAMLWQAVVDKVDLTKAIVTGADFAEARMTGACLEAWCIDHTTNLEGVDCQYVYLLRNQQERRPSSGDFAPGEFTKLFQEALNTVDLIFRKGVDWKAFVAAFKTVQVDNDGTELTIQSIENKGDGVVVVRVSVPETADKAKIHGEFNQSYDLAVKALEAKYHAELKAKDEQITIYREKSADMTEILRLLANRPVTVEVNASAESKAMSDSTDKSQNINISGSNITGSTINLGAISGSVSNVVNQLPSAPDPAQPGIKELLIELQAAIESDADLPEKGKASALENVKVLAEVAQDPEQPEKKGLGSQAITFFKNAASFLPDTAKLAEACTKLLPLITKALGLPF